MQCADNFPFEKTAGDVDVNLPPRANDQVYLTALKTELTKAFSSFEPDLVFYLAGADPYKGDRLGKLDVTKQGLRQRDQWVIDFCRNQEIPISISMAGGYASDVEEIVDIHFATVEIALARFHRDRIHVA
jgi:acetoin utilization deacetylase AcuC-like enzyme